MLYVILILFFGSLFSIIFMIGKKLMALGNGLYHAPEDASFSIPYAEETKNILIKNIKTYEHLILVFLVRFFIQSKNFLVQTTEDSKQAIRRFYFKMYPNGELVEKIENSQFMKIIYKYRRKIREVTHQVKKEENNL